MKEISKKEFEEAYKDGLTYAELAKKFEVSVSTVAGLIKDFDLTGHGNSKGRPKQINIKE